MPKTELNINLEKLHQELAEAAKRYQPRMRFWERWEEDILREFYLKVPGDVLAKKLHRTYQSCQMHAQHMGLQTRNRN